MSKQYIGTAKAIKTIHGGMLKFSAPIDELQNLIDQQRALGETWLNISIARRKEVSDKGYTHSAWLDDWKPEKKQDNHVTQTDQGENFDDDIPPF